MPISNAKKNRVWISQFKLSRADSGIQWQQMAEWLELAKSITKDTRVALKPNLTYSFYKPGVTTSPTFLEAVVEVLKQFTDDIRIVESDGGSNAWTAEQAFAGHNIPDLCQRFGVRAVNLTKQPRRKVATEVVGREIQVELPVPLLDDTDYFITLPVPKVHVMTKVTLGFKNQWGCLPDVKRLNNHPQFNDKIVAIHKLLNTRLAIFDGGYFLNRSGPMDGDPIQMDLLIAGDVGASSLVCCHLMKMNPAGVGHLRVAMEEGIMPRSMDEISLNCLDVSSFRKGQFYLKRTPMNWLTLMVFNSNILTRLVYDSAWAKPIHDILYLVRGRPKDFSPKW